VYGPKGRYGYFTLSPAFALNRYASTFGASHSNIWCVMVLPAPSQFMLQALLLLGFTPLNNQISSNLLDLFYNLAQR
jgi:hypothetical protein